MGGRGSTSGASMSPHCCGMACCCCCCGSGRRLLLRRRLVTGAAASGSVGSSKETCWGVYGRVDLRFGAGCGDVESTSLGWRRRMGVGGRDASRGRIRPEVGVGVVTTLRTRGVEGVDEAAGGSTSIGCCCCCCWDASGCCCCCSRRDSNLFARCRLMAALPPLLLVLLGGGASS